MQARSYKLLFLMLLLAWLIISSIGFGFVNQVSYLQPFFFPGWQGFLEQLTRISPLKYIFDLFVSLAGLSIFSVACVALGLNVLDKLKVHAVSALTTGTSAFIIGEILFSLVFLTILRTHLLTPTITAILLAGGLGLGAIPLWNLGQALQRYHPPGKLSKPQKEILGLTTGIFILSLMLASSRLGYDAVTDYFSQAKLMAVSYESISFYPENFMIVSSLHSDILFTALIQLFGDQSARMLSWANGLAILLMGLAIAEETGLSPRARLYFLTLMLTSTAFVDLLGDGKIELISTAPILAAIYWMLRSLKSQSKGIFLLIGLLAGFAVILRPYNIFLVSLFVALFYIFWLVQKIHAGQSNGNLFYLQAGIYAILPILWMFPTLLALGAFHLWQNWLWLGSPLAPLIYAQNLKTDDWQWQFDPSILNMLRILYLLTVTFFNTPQSLGNISPLFVGFLPFLLVKGIRTRLGLSSRLRHLLLVSIVVLALWIAIFFTVVEIRYVLFLWALLFLPATQVIVRTLAFLPKFIATLIQSLLVVLLIFIAMRSVFIALGTYSPIDKNEQAHCYDIDFCTFFESVNQTAGLGDRVLVLNAYRYYLRPDLFACSSRSNEYPALQELAQKDSPEFWEEVYRYGYRFVIYERNFAEFHSRFGTIPESQIAPSWLQISIISSSEDNDEIVYLVEAVDPPIQPEIHCQLDLRGNWILTSLPALQRYQFPQYIEKYPR